MIIVASMMIIFTVSLPISCTDLPITDDNVSIASDDLYVSCDTVSMVGDGLSIACNDLYTCYIDSVKNLEGVDSAISSDYIDTCCIDCAMRSGFINALDNTLTLGKSGGTVAMAGDITITNNIVLPVSTTTSGVIYKASIAADNRFISNPLSSNTFIGLAAGTLGLTGEYNTALGYQAGNTYAHGESNNIVIGNIGASGDSKIIRIGSVQTSCYVQGIHDQDVGAGAGDPVLINADGKLGTTEVSSLRYKTNIIDMGELSERILNLRLVQFVYKNNPSVKRYGIIAEEAVLVMPELVVCDAQGRPDAVRMPRDLLWMMLNEIQKNHTALQKQSKDMTDQHKKIECLLARIEDLEKNKK
jgi:hypothetical protein